MKPSKSGKETENSPNVKPSVTQGLQISKIRQTPEKVAPTTGANNGPKYAAATSQEIDPISSSSNQLTKMKQLKAKGSWYGTWPRKSAASTKIAKESIHARKISDKLNSYETNQFEAMVPIRDTRPPAMCFGKSKETIGITMATTGDEGNFICESKMSSQAKTEEVHSDHLCNGVSASQPELDKTSSNLETSNTSTLNSYGWFGSWLGGSNSQLHTDNQPICSIDSSTQVFTEVSRPDGLKSAETSPQYNLVGVSQPTEDKLSKINNSGTWLGWFSPFSSSAETLKEQTTASMAKLAQHTGSSDSSPEITPLINSSTSKSGYLWSFWSRDPSNHFETSVNTTINEQILNTDETKPQSSGSSNLTMSKDKQNQENALKSQASKKNYVNLLLPSLKSTYQVYEAPSPIEKITRLFYFKPQINPSIYLSREKPKVKKALAIGVHGLFPAPFLRTVIGQPTGTSIRFVNHAANAIRRWTKMHSIEECEIQKVSLEGGGKIAERVDNLWKILLNWIDHAQKADFILVACHSQGVPVAIMLVAKLIEFGVVSTCRIGVCAMAGVSLGPFVEFKSRLIGGSAGELFELADTESDISKRYERSLRVSLKFGVRIMFCGSIDDQLVSLESSIFSTVSHPYIYRAVFIDGRLHSSDFLSHLVGFALKLRNIGVSDHGLIRELSAPLAGSLYTGEGHSRLYDDPNVYNLAVQFALETTSVGDVPLEVKKYEIPTITNPYLLPWIMRGLLEENIVKNELFNETTELIQKFDSWKPTTKVLKDVKYRLEAVKSKL